MTNTEWFEKNNVSFAEAMKEFNGQKTIKSFDEFLKIEHIEHKFKIGDIVVLQLNDETLGFGWRNNVVFEIIGTDIYYKAKCLTPTKCHDIGDYHLFPIKFIDSNCVFY